MEIVRIGLDLAKNIFEVHGVDAQDNAILRKTLRRDAVSQCPSSDDLGRLSIFRLEALAHP